MADVLSSVNAILGSPAVRAGLKIAAPELTLAVDLARLVGATLTRPRSRQARELVAAIDERVAEYIGKLADPTSSKAIKRELEIRTHELLGVLQAWKQ